MALEASSDDTTAPDWRPAALAVLAELDRELDVGPWELVPVDGTESVRSSDDPEIVTDEDGGLEVPLVLPDGSVFATLRSLTKATLGAGSHDAERLQAMSRLLESLVSAHQAAQRAGRRADAAEAAALTDTLTGLLNRGGWRLAMRAEEARSHRTASIALLAVVDLDGLKAVNDTQGHLAGDVLLRLTGATLRQAIRAEDVLARVGGDEFCVIAVDYKPPVPNVLATRLHDCLDAADIAASIGAVVRSPDESMAEALHRADRAMYANKRQRKPQHPY